MTGLLIALVASMIALSITFLVFAFARGPSRAAHTSISIRSSVVDSEPSEAPWFTTTASGLAGTTSAVPLIPIYGTTALLSFAALQRAATESGGWVTFGPGIRRLIAPPVDLTTTYVFMSGGPPMIINNLASLDIRLTRRTVPSAA
jgi:hypothetical protein